VELASPADTNIEVSTKIISNKKQAVLMVRIRVSMFMKCASIGPYLMVIISKRKCICMSMCPSMEWLM
jgi:hypothetical protein